MHSPRFLDHFENPRNVGQLAAPALKVEVSNPACGDILVLYALLEEGVFTEVRYQVRGCTASIAAGSALTELVLNKTPLEAAAIGREDVEAALGGLRNESKHVTALAIDAVRALVEAASQAR
jgi:nitrogen fixation NifU-like protein